MQLLKSIVNAAYWIYSTMMILIGFGTIILSFINSPLQLQIALGLIGLGFISLGLVQIKRLQDENRNKERFVEIMAKLDEIQQELKKEDQSKVTGVAIADLITSGLKYYTEHMIQQKKEQNNE